MSVRRRNTIHDLSSLRLHPDGSRVHNISRSKDSDEAAGVSTRLAKYTTRDAQGRWIAYDAGGLVTVKQRTRQKDARVRQTRSSDAEMRSDEDEMPFAGPSQVSRWKASATDNNSDEENMEDLEGYIKNSKAQKRMKFYHDYSFLEDPQLELRISAGQVTPALIDDEFPSLGINFPVPSSELLKGIHHFASHYYTEKGWLYNAPALANRMRNQRKLKDLRRSVAEGNARRSTDGRDSLEDIVRHASMTTFEDKEELSDKDAKPVPKQSKEAKELPQRDMYRAFDGSALMAIGMLVQEYVAQVASPMPSDEWLEQMTRVQNTTGKKRRKRKYRQQDIEHTEEGIETHPPGETSGVSDREIEDTISDDAGEDEPEEANTTSESEEK